MIDRNEYDLSLMASAMSYALEAGEQIVSRMKEPYDIQDKVNRSDLVTEVDLHSERLIRGRIVRDYPDHWILSEETDGAGDAFERMKRPVPGYGWIVDPIDGTINFVQGIPHFAVSIGIMKDGELLHGVVYNPVSRELYRATLGQGAYRNGERLRVSTEDAIGNAVLATGFQASDWRPDSVTERQIKRTVGVSRNVRVLGAASLDLCLVASGALTGFWHDGLHPWDVAAGVLIVREAGGEATDASGKPYELSDRRLFASNGQLLESFLALIDER